MIAIDTHVHIYPSFNIERLLHAVERNVTRLTSCTAATLCLTEKCGCFFWEETVSLRRARAGMVWEGRDDGLLAHLKLKSGFIVTFVRGYQYVSKEGVEVLGLATEVRPEDRVHSAADLLEIVRAAGGVPVLPWSLGKWMGQRGNVVRGLLEDNHMDPIPLGDILQRSSRHSLSKLLESGGGARVFAGSDPLPLSGEEDVVGAFLTVIRSEESIPQSIECLRGILTRTEQNNLQLLGTRNSLTEAALRWLRLQYVQRVIRRSPLETKSHNLVEEQG